ncbi:MAG: hypothetical protein ACFBZ8_03840 [Opitutales bacterium]
MTQEAFENLVNLYLDGEIESDDCCRLMEEVERNPQRRKQFDDFCRLHSAVQLALFSRNLSEPRQPAEANNSRLAAVKIDQLQRSRAIMSVVETSRSRQRRRRRMVRFNQLAGMAACVALLVGVIVAGSWKRLPAEAQSFLGTKNESDLVARYQDGSTAQGQVAGFEGAPEVIFGQQPTEPAVQFRVQAYQVPANRFAILAGGEWMLVGGTLQAPADSFEFNSVDGNASYTPNDGLNVLQALQPLQSASDSFQLTGGATPSGLRQMPVPMAGGATFFIDLSRFGQPSE